MTKYHPIFTKVREVYFKLNNTAATQTNYKNDINFCFFLAQLPLPFLAKLPQCPNACPSLSLSLSKDLFF